jgi:hypothetical protein
MSVPSSSTTVATATDLQSKRPPYLETQTHSDTESEPTPNLSYKEEQCLSCKKIWINCCHPVTDTDGVMIDTHHTVNVSSGPLSRKASASWPDMPRLRSSSTRFTGCSQQVISSFTS